MTSRDFCYWFQGYLEVATAGDKRQKTPVALDTEQIKCIQKHLNLVFKHEIDPSFGEDQTELNNIHSGHSGEPIIRC